MYRFNRLKFQLISLFLCAGLVNLASAQEFFSKRDARQLFDSSLEEWNMNASMLHEQGVVSLVDEAASGYGIETRSDEYYMRVNPNYSTSENPDFLSVAIGYSPEVAGLLNRAELEAVVADAIEQLKPEFEMTADIEEVGGGIGIFATIRERGEY